MSLPTLPKVQKLQDALHAKAKGWPEYRFYALYDKVYRDDVLWVAYRRCLINGGAAGVDGQTFEDIERYGVRKWLGELAEELRTKTYRPSPVRSVRTVQSWVAKARRNGVEALAAKPHASPMQAPSPSCPPSSGTGFGSNCSKGRRPTASKPTFGRRPECSN